MRFGCFFYHSDSIVASEAFNDADFWLPAQSYCSFHCPPYGFASTSGHLIFSSLQDLEFSQRVSSVAGKFNCAKNPAPIFTPRSSSSCLLKVRQTKSFTTRMTVSGGVLNHRFNRIASTFFEEARKPILLQATLMWSDRHSGQDIIDVRKASQTLLRGTDTHLQKRRTGFQCAVVNI